MNRIVASVFALVFGFVGDTALAGVVENGRLPDGTYECTMLSGSMVMSMGNISIKGLTYQGPAFDNKYEATYPYAMSSKVVLWKGPLGGLSSGGNSVVSTVVTENDPGKASFNFVIQTSSGNHEDVSCSLQR